MIETSWTNLTPRWQMQIPHVGDRMATSGPVRVYSPRERRSRLVEVPTGQPVPQLTVNPVPGRTP